MSGSQNSDRFITDFGLVLKAVEHIPEFFEHTVELFDRLFDFLESEGLLTKSIRHISRQEFRTCKLRYSDLTPEGQMLFRPPINAFYKWLTANEKIDKPISMRSLQNGIKKIREMKRED